MKSFINAKYKEEIIFTKNATEAINLIATTFGAQNIKNGDEIRVSYFQVSGAMGPGTELTYKGVPRKPVEAEELSKWAMDVE